MLWKEFLIQGEIPLGGDCAIPSSLRSTSKDQLALQGQRPFSREARASF
jgi:hypothetical protein